MFGSYFHLSHEFDFSSHYDVPETSLELYHQRMEHGETSVFGKMHYKCQIACGAVQFVLELTDWVLDPLY